MSNMASEGDGHTWNQKICYVQKLSTFAYLFGIDVGLDLSLPRAHLTIHSTCKDEGSLDRCFAMVC